jgi:hypothetical protein
LGSRRLRATLSGRKPKEQIEIDARLSGNTVVVMQQLPDMPAVTVIDTEPAPSPLGSWQLRTRFWGRMARSE